MIGDTHQLAFALDGNCGIAMAVQTAQGKAMQPQTLYFCQLRSYIDSFQQGVRAKEPTSTSISNPQDSVLHLVQHKQLPLRSRRTMVQQQ